ncbi:MAG: cbb3-type cytochrome oxidase assembly protein CcoS [Bacteriovorax sp.]|nr:cbb3-type cytochrome oxidase assembly protein CcoS [Bacteriovorax sp.]
MEVITILIPLALLLALTFIVGFIWMTVKGQYDDLETPAMRMLIEEKKLSPTKNIISNQEKS